MISEKCEGLKILKMALKIRKTEKQKIVKLCCIKM
tara:strand:+ start:181 stop:285 length:105 start_codon:yes stop_codon:yes gene_type:complete